MDEATLTKMVDEIAVVLCKHLPQGDATTLHSASSQMRSKSCAQVFAFTPGKGGVFSINAELSHPPPTPSELNLKGVISK